MCGCLSNFWYNFWGHAMGSLEFLELWKCENLLEVFGRFGIFSDFLGIISYFGHCLKIFKIETPKFLVLTTSLSSHRPRKWVKFSLTFRYALSTPGYRWANLSDSSFKCEHAVICSLSSLCKYSTTGALTIPAPSMRTRFLPSGDTSHLCRDLLQAKIEN